MPASRQKHGGQAEGGRYRLPKAFGVHFDN